MTTRSTRRVRRAVPTTWSAERVTQKGSDVGPRHSRRAIKMETKQCNRCGEMKAAHADHWLPRGNGFRAPCRECRNARAREERARDPEKSIALSRKRYAARRETLRAQARERYALAVDRHRALSRARYAANIEEYRTRARERYAANPTRQRVASKKWLAKNPDKPREYWTRSDQKRRANPRRVLASRVGALIREALKKRGAGKTRRAPFITGWTIDELAVHLGALFETGMSFSNFGEWEIDHIVPLSRIDFDGETDPRFKAAWALSNLAPLWAADNAQKHARNDWPLPDRYKNSRLRALYESADWTMAQ